MQIIEKHAIVIMAAALCATVTVTATCARGVTLGCLDITRRRFGRRGLVQFINKSSSFTDNDRKVPCRGVGKVFNNKSGIAFVSSSPSVRTKGISEDKQQRYQRHPLSQQQPQCRSSSTQVNDAEMGEFYANPKSFPDFSSLGITSPALLRRLTSPPLSLKRPSAVQAAVFETISRGKNDVIVGAETGSGKTLSYLLPLVEDVLRRKREWRERMERSGDEYNDQVVDPGYDFARAIILVPNKELAHQAMRMAAAICGGSSRCIVWGAEAMGMDYNHFLTEDDIPEDEIVRLALLPGGLSAPQDFPPFRFATSRSPNYTRQSPPDLLFATPANLGPLALSPKHIDFFSDISTLVVDEADMLLDGGYIRQLNNVLMGFRRADRLLEKYDLSSFRCKSNDIDEVEQVHNEECSTSMSKKTQHIFVAATLPDYGLRSVDAFLKRKFPNAISITMEGMHNARHYGLENESKTVWNELEENKERMIRLVDLLKLDRRHVGVDGRGLKDEKVMVFLNTAKDVDGATNGLRRAGINALPYHAKLSLDERISNLEKFRLYDAPANCDGDTERKVNDNNTVPVLVCTDAASRGLDIPGVTTIVQLQFALNVVSHLHRMGRSGRAGNRNGRGIVFYGPKERELVAVVMEAEEQQSRLTLIQDVEEVLDDSGCSEMNKVKEEGKVQKAFSRKRGFTKKRKNEHRKALESVSYNDDL